MAKQTKCISMQGTMFFYRITVVNSQNEVEDGYVGAKSSTVRQVIEHPDEMQSPCAIEG
ncbi:MAG: hypothetical protein WBO24_02935 [Nitrospirales bacterium]